MKRLVLGGEWGSKRLKAVRKLRPDLSRRLPHPGGAACGSGGSSSRLARGHPSYELLLRARQRILALIADPFPQHRRPLPRPIVMEATQPSQRQGHDHGLRACQQPTTALCSPGIRTHGGNILPDTTAPAPQTGPTSVGIITFTVYALAVPGLNACPTNFGDPEAGNTRARAGPGDLVRDLYSEPIRARAVAGVHLPRDLSRLPRTGSAGFALSISHKSVGRRIAKVPISLIPQRDTVSAFLPITSFRKLWCSRACPNPRATAFLGPIPCAAGLSGRIKHQRVFADGLRDAGDRYFPKALSASQNNSG